jgi:hypothetical protein
MQGRSLVANLDKSAPKPTSQESDKEKIIRERLAGLGYI